MASEATAIRRLIVRQQGAYAVVLMDSISYIGPEDRDHIVVSGSHGGTAAATYTTSQPLQAVFFNDAGIGKDNAGIAALAILDQVGTACCVVAHTSARIGEAGDIWEHGIISHINATAQQQGLSTNTTVQEAVETLLRRCEHMEGKTTLS